MKLTLDKLIIFIFLVVSYYILFLPNTAYSQPGLPRNRVQIKDENTNVLNPKDFIILKGNGVYHVEVNEFSDGGSLSLGSHQIDLTLIYSGRVMKIVDSSFSENSFSSQIIFRPGVFELDKNSRTSNIKPTDKIPILNLLYVSNKTPSFNKLDAQEALNWVCYTGNTKNFLFVLENFDKSKLDYNIALGQALIYNNHNLVPLLKELGAEAKLIPQKTVIEICDSGDETSLQLLVDGKVNFSFPTDYSYGGESPLGRAISNSSQRNLERIKIVKMLVNAGADVNLDPRYLAMASPNLELMKLLVENGLNTKAKYPYPYSSVENRFFLDEDQATVANEVLKNTLHAYFRPLDYEIQHLRYEKDYEEIQKKHREQLKVRVFETISFLVKNGADINLKFYFREDLKETPLEIAKARQDKELSALLIKLGAMKD
ncbi:MAG: hypothetical protein HY819_09765 [Acidobacteria bacterium]|nr:hypothetical protein [Acidobacteriota bacterium]